MKEDGEIWFPAKRYGWGWGLANCWQGLLIQGGYIVLVILGARLLLARGEQTWFWILFGLVTALLIAIHCWKGEKPQWRWGDRG